MTILLDITPAPKPRQTRADKWKKRPAVMRYRAFADEVRLRFRDSDGLNRTKITFYMPMPKSWGKLRKELTDNTPHIQRPDIDNLAKSLFDAVYKDDSHIYDVRLVKMWAYKGAIKIERLPYLT